MFVSSLVNQLNDLGIDKDKIKLEIKNGQCAYCKIDDPELVIKCKNCSVDFCNGKGFSLTSHILFHLINSGHKEIDFKLQNSVGNRDKCNLCECSNVFKLGYVTSTKNNRLLLCRPPCEKFIEEDIGHKIGERDKKVLIRKLVFEDRDRYIEAFRLKTSQLCSRDEMVPMEKDFKFENWKPLIMDKFLIGHIKKNPTKPDDLFKCRLITNTDLKLIENELKKRRCEEIPDKYKFNGIETRDIINFEQEDFKADTEPTKLLNFENGFEYKKAFSKLLTYENSIEHFSEKEVNGSEVIFQRCSEALSKFETNSNGMSQDIYNVILGKKKITNSSNELLTNIIYNIPNLPDLNFSQRSAVKQCLSQPFSLIQGPPGTGKTHVAAAIVFNFFKLIESSGTKEKILVVAPSNYASDNLANLIKKSGLKVIRIISNRREEDLEYDCPLSVHHRMNLHDPNSLLSEIVKLRSELGTEINSKSINWMKKIVLNHLVDQSDVVCVTCMTSASKKLGDHFRFKYVLIDETCQSLEPEIIVPLNRGVEKLVLLGDIKQLGPVVKNKATTEAGLEQSLMERLASMGNKSLLLDVQYRMHPKIAQFSNITFYDGLLKNGITEAQRTLNSKFKWPNDKKPIIFICFNDEEQISETGFSYLNREEGFLIRKIVDKLITNGVNPNQIGICTPYEGQKDHLRITLPFFSKNDDYKNIEVHSVNAYQGREKDVIILSTVRCNYYKGKKAVGFLSDSRRLNVSLTRAKYGLIVLGDPETLCNDPVWFELLQFYQKNNLMFTGSIDNLKPFNGELKKPNN